MIKKYSKIFALAFITYFISIVPVFAREMTLDELGKEIEDKYDGIYAYIIGDYVFTSEHTLTTQDIMLASMNISVTDETGKTAQDNIYGEMTIYEIDQVYNGDTPSWEVSNNLVGKERLNTDKINVRYIDYDFVSEKTKFEVSVEKADEEDSEYKKNLKEVFNFDGNKSNSVNLKLENGKLTGLIKKNSKIDETVFESEDLTGYYFAFVVEVPGATDKTTVQMVGKNTVDAKYSDFDKTEGETKGIASLWSLNPNSENKIITITVDLDGDGIEYGPTVYTIDWSEVTFQEDSKADITTNIPDADKDSFKEWGYSFIDGEYSFDSESTDPLMLNGLIAVQHTNNGIFADEGEDGYYFAFNISPEEILDGIEIKLSGAEQKTFNKSSFGEDTSLSVLYKLDDKCNSEENTDDSKCQITVEVDLDGEEGEAYLPTTYTIDYSKVVFAKSSKFSVTEVTSENESKITSAYSWTKGEGYSVSFEGNGNEVKVSGLIPIDTESKVTNKVFEEEHLTGYYFPYAIKLEATATDATTIKFVGDETDAEKIITGKSSFDDPETYQEIYVLKHIHPDSEIKTFTIEVDIDGEDEEYAPYTITVDWSELQLQTYSTVTKVTVANDTAEEGEDGYISEEDKQQLNDVFGYSFDKAQVTISSSAEEDSKTDYTLAGKVIKQTLKDKSFVNPTGYFVPVKVYFPEYEENSYLEQYKDKWTLTLNTEDGEPKNVKPSEEDYENGFITVLFRIERPEEEAQETQEAKKYISYKIDFDGEGNVFLPTEVTIDYSKLTFEGAVSETTVETEQPKITDQQSGYNSENQDYQLQQEGSNVSISGYITESKKDGSEESGKYLFAVTLNPIYTEDIEIIVTKDGKSTKYTNKDFKDNVISAYSIAPISKEETRQITLLLEANKEAEIKQYDIVVDSDGAEGIEYSEYSMTVDYSDLALGLKEYVENATKKTNEAKSLKIINEGTKKLTKEYDKDTNRMVTELEDNNEKKQYYLESLDGNSYIERDASSGFKEGYQDIFERTINKEDETNENNKYGDWKYVFHGYQSFIVDDLKLLEGVQSVTPKEAVETSDEEESSDEKVKEYTVTVSDEAVSNYLKYMYGASDFKVDENENLTTSSDKTFTVGIKDGYVVSIKGTISATVNSQSKTYQVDTKIENIGATKIDPSNYGMDEETFSNEQKLAMRTEWDKKKKEEENEKNQK